MRNWLILFDGYSGHIEIYRNEMGHKDLVKIVPSQAAAWSFLNQTVNEQDVLMFRKAAAGGVQEASVKAAVFRQGGLDNSPAEWWAMRN